MFQEKYIKPYSLQTLLFYRPYMANEINHVLEHKKICFKLV